MTRDSSLSVFASYARAEEAIVRPLVELLCASLLPDDHEMWSGRSLVFLDQQSLTPGKPWREQIDSAVSRCSKMMVFWCEHAATSTEVRREVELALALRKPVIPVMLDGCPLSNELSALHAVDLRRLNLHPVGPEYPYKILSTRAKAPATPFSVELANDFAELFELDASQLAIRIENAWGRAIV